MRHSCYHFSEEFPDANASLTTLKAAAAQSKLQSTTTNLFFKIVSLLGIPRMLKGHWLQPHLHGSSFESDSSDRNIFISQKRLNCETCSGSGNACSCAGVVVQTGSRPRLTWSEEAGHALSTLLGLNKSNFCRLWSMEVSSLPYLPHLKRLLTF